MDAFFQKLDLPRVSPNDNRTLDAPLTLPEIKEAISSMNSDESPGPDGWVHIELSLSFISNFLTSWPLYFSTTSEMFNYSYSHGSLPLTLVQATISLIHKKDMDPLNSASYRPISLLPVDVKILVKVLACRLGPIIPLIISENQTGFIGGRHYFSDVRRLLGVIHTPSSPIP